MILIKKSLTSSNRDIVLTPTKPVPHSCFSTSYNDIVDDDEKCIVRGLPVDPTLDKEVAHQIIDGDWGIQFSHTVAEVLLATLKAGFSIDDLYEDTNGEGRLHELNIPSMLAVKATKIG